MKLLFIMMFIALLAAGCGGENKSTTYPETENKPSDSKNANWDKGAWDNFKWQ